jgi:hypothetical protein
MIKDSCRCAGVVVQFLALGTGCGAGSPNNRESSPLRAPTTSVTCARPAESPARTGRGQPWIMAHDQPLARSAEHDFGGDREAGQVCPAGRLSASRTTAWAGIGGEAAGEWRGLGFWACLTGCTPEGASVTWCTGLALVRASSGPRLVPPVGMAVVQHGSTATHLDAGGRVGTREDGDLHGWTRVDVLPPDGMQEVSGSSPLSSTGQKRNSNSSNSEYSSKVPQPGSLQIPHTCSALVPRR